MFNHVSKLKWPKFVVGVISEGPSVDCKSFGRQGAKRWKGYFTSSSARVFGHPYPLSTIVFHRTLLRAEDRRDMALRIIRLSLGRRDSATQWWVWLVHISCVVLELNYSWHATSSGTRGQHARFCARRYGTTICMTVIDPSGRRKTSSEFPLHHLGGVLRGALDETEYTSREVSQLASGRELSECVPGWQVGLVARVVSISPHPRASIHSSSHADHK